MLLEQVTLRNFRNIRECSLSLPPGLSVFWGENGQGKTNFLESIYFLSYGRPLRGESLSRLIRWESSSLSASTRVRKGEVSLPLTITMKKGEKPEIRHGERRVNSLREHIGTLVSVAFQGEDGKLLFGPPPGRRKLLDQTCYLLKPSYGEELLDFLRALRQRNGLLKLVRDGEAGTGVLSSFDQVFLERAERVSRVRREVFGKLRRAFEEVMEEVGGGVRATLKEKFGFSPESFRGALDEDIRTGTTTVGPHRDDFSVFYGERDGRHYASTGQKRVLIIAFRLAQALLVEEEKKENPILLLDDLTSEVDASGRERVLEFVCRRGNQALVTTTDRKLIPERAVTGGVFQVCGGQIL
ncbi:MAG: DNA replication and repair protein RecF [Deltaproteobacteria bacterium]|nr:MAG: DNA replication and repair protein RecF [Deltaproteobacteria bacterium]